MNVISSSAITLMITGSPVFGISLADKLWELGEDGAL